MDRATFVACHLAFRSFKAAKAVVKAIFAEVSAAFSSVSPAMAVAREAHVPHG
jgi:hypothetical protein